MSQWFVVTPVGEVGPMSRSDLDKLVAEGKVTGETLIRSDAMNEAVPANQVKGLLPADSGFIGETQPLASGSPKHQPALPGLRSNEPTSEATAANTKTIGLVAAGILGAVLLGWMTGLPGGSSSDPVAEKLNGSGQSEAAAITSLDETQRVNDERQRQIREEQQWQDQQRKEQEEYERQQAEYEKARIEEEKQRQLQREAEEKERERVRQERIRARQEQERLARLEEEKRIREEQERVAAEAARIAAEEKRQRELVESHLNSPEEFVLLYHEGKNDDEALQFASAKTLETSTRLWSDGNTLQGGYHRVANAPTLLLGRRNQQRFWGFATEGARVVDFAAKKLRRYYPGNNRKELVSSDLQRVLKIDKGDIWKADVNWEDGQTKEFQRVTNIQACDEFKPLIWSGNIAFFLNPANPKQPLVRIDLMTGELEERSAMFPENSRYETGSTWQGRYDRGIAFPDPKNRVAVVFNRERIWLKDLQTDEERFLSNLYKYPHEADANAYLYDQITLIPKIDFGDSYDEQSKKSSLWYDNHTLVTACVGGIAVINIPAASVEVIKLGLPEIDIYREYREFKSEAFIRKPVGKKLWVTTTQQDAPAQHVLVDIRSGEIQKLPEWIDNATWLDEKYVVRSVAKGNLSELGHWLVDHATGQQQRITARRELEQFRTNDYRSASWFYMKSTGKLFFNQDESWHAYDLATAKTTALPDWQDVTRILTTPNKPVDLGIEQDTAWLVEEPLPYFTEAQRSIQPTDRDRVASLLADQADDLPAGVVKLCWETVEQLRTTHRAHPEGVLDPVKVLQQFLKDYKTIDPSLKSDKLVYEATTRIQEVIRSVPPERSRLRAWGYKKCIQRFIAIGNREDSWMTYTTELKQRLKPQFLQLADRYVAEYKANGDRNPFYSEISDIRKRLPKALIELKAVSPTQSGRVTENGSTLEKTSTNQPKTPKPKTQVPDSVPRKLSGIYKKLMSADQNGDDRISPEELRTLFPSRSAAERFFNGYDKNADGYIDQTDF